MFDSSMAISYAFNSKEPGEFLNELLVKPSVQKFQTMQFLGVLDYIGNRLFTYPDEEMNFFLPQLVNMYIMYPEVAEAIHPYIVHR